MLSGSGPFPPPGLVQYTLPVEPRMATSAFSGPLTGGSAEYPAVAPSYDISSPHSFYGGSQASVPADENGNTLTNGRSVSNHDGPNGFVPPVDSFAGQPNAGNLFGYSQGPPPPEADPRHRLTDYVRHQFRFNGSEFADCVVIFSLPGPNASASAPGSQDEQQTFSFAGSRLILAQSRLFRSLFHSSDPAQSGSPIPYRVMLNHPHITQEAVHSALGTMYGHPVADIPINNRTVEGRKAGMDMVLAIVNVGLLFDLPAVTLGAVQQADRYLDWANVEAIAAFCLRPADKKMSGNHVETSAVTNGPIEGQHGLHAAEWHRGQLLHAIARFITFNLPLPFGGQTSVGASPPFSRFPALGELRSSSSYVPDSHTSAAPSSSNHSRSHSARQSQDARLSFIRFGDFSPPTTNGVGSAEPSGPGQNGKSDSPGRQQTESDNHHLSSANDQAAVASRIMTCVPFEILKSIVENKALGATRGGISVHDRHMVMQNVIAEREAQRSRAINTLMHDQVQGAESILAGTATPSGTAWDTVRLEEFVATINDHPYIERRPV